MTVNPYMRWRAAFAALLRDLTLQGAFTLTLRKLQ
jgi:hypothetical protein